VRGGRRQGLGGLEFWGNARQFSSKRLCWLAALWELWETSKGRVKARVGRLCGETCFSEFNGQQQVAAKRLSRKPALDNTAARASQRCQGPAALCQVSPSLRHWPLQSFAAHTLCIVLSCLPQVFLGCST